MTNPASLRPPAGSARSAHVDGDFCPGCYLRLQHVHPEIARFFQTVKKNFPDFHVSWGYRSASEQQQAYDSGASNAKPGTSLHNAIDSKKQPCSRAIDLFILDADGISRWPGVRFQKLHDWKAENFAATMHKPVIRFKNSKGHLVVDLAHYQLAESVTQP